MPVNVDPEGSELSALRQMVPSWSGLRVLEVGVGKGRLTWHYAREAGYVVGLEPDAEDLAQARAGLPAGLEGHVELHAARFEDYEAPLNSPAFDVVFLSWSL
jgi:tRNA A58 N-methylase Trm61